MSVTKLDKDGFIEKISNGKGMQVVDFSATWCGPCRMLAPILEELSEENPDIAFYNVDVDEEQALAAHYRIVAVPSVYVFEDGKMKGSFAGLRSKEDIEAMLK